MKKYEAPIAELEIFAVENVMTTYGESGGDDDIDWSDISYGTNDTPIA